jgi:purine-nucleoside phosphorylase
MQNPEKVQLAVNAIRKRIPGEARIGLILGTGLGRIAEELTEKKHIAYEDIPGFPSSTADSHVGGLAYGLLGSTPVWTLQGRFHLYEGYSPAQVCIGVRALAGLGVKTLLITNAAGGLDPLWPAGSLMLVTDHINLTGASPLEGPNHAAWGPRFPDMSVPYCPELRAKAMEAALKAGIRLERGVYVGVRGPNLETPAETRAFRLLGADAIGMSTVLEVIAARHMGLRVLAISSIANQNLPDCMAETSAEEIIAMADASAASLAELLRRIVALA